VRYSDYKCFKCEFDSGVAFVSINHPPINLLDEVLSQEFDQLGRELESDESVRVVVLQSALPDYFIAHSGLSRVGNASKIVSHTRSFRLTQMIGERFRNMPKAASGPESFLLDRFGWPERLGSAVQRLGDDSQWGQLVRSSRYLMCRRPPNPRGTLGCGGSN
jgi:hypothetical protein